MEKPAIATPCVSTQVGCAYGCRFCASGLDGWKRNLEVHEIVGQLLAIEIHCREELSEGQDRKVNNLVIMGMGEPMANYDNLMKALDIINAPWGCHIGARKITLSTSGLAPQIEQLASQPHQYRLAISLHGATDEVRSRIMPVNRKYPLPTLMQACESYVGAKGKMITFEYILIEGVNDGDDQIQPLARWAQQLHAKVNLIPYNHVEGLRWNGLMWPLRKPFFGAPSVGCEGDFASRKRARYRCGMWTASTQGRKRSTLRDILLDTPCGLGEKGMPLPFFSLRKVDRIRSFFQKPGDARCRVFLVIHGWL